jgi:Domain of unknown function (DUF4440)
MTKIILFLCLICCSSVFSQSKDQLEVQKFLELFRLKMIEPDAKVLEHILHEKLIYGHSNGTNETKKDVIEVLTTGKSDYIKLEFANPIYTFSKNTAVVRCDFLATLLDKSKNTSELNLKTIMILVKEKNEWKLFSRQGYRLPVTPK